MQFNQIWNKDKSRCGCKYPRENVCEKCYVWNPAQYARESGKQLGSIIDNPALCDEIIGTTKNILTKTNENKLICKMKNSFSLLAFLLIAKTLLITISIYCCFIKYQIKQKYLISFHDTSIKEIDIKNIS